MGTSGGVRDPSPRRRYAATRALPRLSGAVCRLPRAAPSSTQPAANVVGCLAGDASLPRPLQSVVERLVGRADEPSEIAAHAKRQQQRAAGLYTQHEPSARGTQAGESGPRPRAVRVDERAARGAADVARAGRKERPRAADSADGPWANLDGLAADELDGVSKAPLAVDNDRGDECVDRHLRAFALGDFAHARQGGAQLAPPARLHQGEVLHTMQMQDKPTTR
mmetsp:Transcript_95027/g.271722  ORF Transcript_95027/g.271722 Transcript_95027/m.271722 type:complete len:223 (-) Transcript_95027:49-717(-)